MENKENQQNQSHTQRSSSATEKNWYDRSYKWTLILPALLLLFSVIYLVNFYNQNHDIIYKDVTLTGGTTVTVFDSSINPDKLEADLKLQFPDLITRSISDIRTGKQEGFFVETKAEPAVIKSALEKYLNYKLTSDNSSTEFSGASLSSGFYQQLRNGILGAFLLMGWVVFIIFAESRKIKGISTILSFLGFSILLPGISFISALSFVGIIAGLIYGLTHKNKNKNDYLLIGITEILALMIFFLYPALWIIVPIGAILAALYIIYSIPSFAVILCALADIIMTITVVNILHIQLSTAGIVAFLMLIGYSVDTDILLTTRLLKDKEGHVNKRIFGAFKTGMTMTLAAIASVAVSLIIIYNFSDALRQIFSIILIGLLFDIINTWVTNGSILKWYMEVKHIA